MKKSLVLSGALALIFGFMVAAWAQGNATEEAATARAHAMLAHNASTLDSAHTHLHHVINCLVGPGGQGYDADAGTPCQGMGNGAIPDSKGNDSLHQKLETALKHAQKGLQADSLEGAQKHAAMVAATIGDTSGQKSSGGYSW